jgi:hypothetical protein
MLLPAAMSRRIASHSSTLRNSSASVSIREAAVGTPGWGQIS